MRGVFKKDSQMSEDRFRRIPWRRIVSRSLRVCISMAAITRLRHASTCKPSLGCISQIIILLHPLGQRLTCGLAVENFGGNIYFVLPGEYPQFFIHLKSLEEIQIGQATEYAALADEL